MTNRGAALKWHDRGFPGWSGIITAAALFVLAPWMPSMSAQTVVGLTCVPQTITAPGTSSCTVTINQPATPGFFVNILPTNGDATAPTSVNIPTGSTAASFTATVPNVLYDEVSTLEAYVNLTTQLFQLYITAQPQITSVACGTNSLASGQTSTCTVTINKVSGGPAVINLSSSNQNLTIPASITIPSGSLSTTFTAMAGTVAAFQAATVTATWATAYPTSVTTTMGLGPTGNGSLIVTGVTDAANNWATTSCTAGGWRTIAGGGFTAAPSQSSSPATTLAGVQVTVNGVAAPLTYVSASQITFQCPALDAGTPLVVKVLGTISTLTVPIQTMVAASPAILVVDSARNDQGLVLNGNTTTLAMPQTPGVASAPAVKGSYISLFATGLGPLQGTNPALAVNQVRVWMGGVAVTPSFVGAAKTGNGIVQVIAQIPNTVQSGPVIPLYLEVDLPGGAVMPSNQVMIAVN